MQNQSHATAIKVCEWLFSVSWLYSFVIGLGFTGYHLVVWLKTGVWPSFTNHDVLKFLKVSDPHMTWVGVQKVVGWVLTWPFAATGFWSLAALAMVVLWIQIGLEDSKPTRHYIFN